MRNKKILEKKNIKCLQKNNKSYEQNIKYWKEQ